MGYEEGYIAFIDVLGFSQCVLEEANADKVDDLYYFFNLVRNSYKDYKNEKTNVAIYSDSIVISSDEFEHLLFPIGMFEFFLQSKLGLLFRGGITKGNYYHKDYITFGPAVIKAYNLEKEAKYSRILIDTKTIDIKDKGINVFQDIDGEICLNPFRDFIKGSDHGVAKKCYPNEDPRQFYLKRVQFARESILASIKRYKGTKIMDKYYCRIFPFNYTCEQIAKTPTSIQAISLLSKLEQEAFSDSLKALKISNFEIECSVQSKKYF